MPKLAKMHWATWLFKWHFFSYSPPRFHFIGLLFSAPVDEDELSFCSEFMNTSANPIIEKEMVLAFNPSSPSWLS